MGNPRPTMKGVKIHVISNLWPVVALYGSKLLARRVVAWDDEGHALVLPSTGGRLVRADSLPDFEGLDDDAPESPLDGG